MYLVWRCAVLYLVWRCAVLYLVWRCAVLYLVWRCAVLCFFQRNIESFQVYCTVWVDMRAPVMLLAAWNVLVYVKTSGL